MIQKARGEEGLARDFFFFSWKGRRDGMVADGGRGLEKKEVKLIFDGCEKVSSPPPPGEKKKKTNKKNTLKPLCKLICSV